MSIQKYKTLDLRYASILVAVVEGLSVRGSGEVNPCNDRFWSQLVMHLPSGTDWHSRLLLFERDARYVMQWMAGARFEFHRIRRICLSLR